MELPVSFYLFFLISIVHIIRNQWNSPAGISIDTPITYAEKDQVGNMATHDTYSVTAPHCVTKGSG